MYTLGNHILKCRLGYHLHFIICRINQQGYSTFNSESLPFCDNFQGELSKKGGTSRNKLEIFQKLYPNVSSLIEKQQLIDNNYNESYNHEKVVFKKNSELVKYLKTNKRMASSLDPNKPLTIKYAFNKDNQQLRIPKITKKQISMSPTKFKHNYFKFLNKNELVDCLAEQSIIDATKIQCKAIPIIQSGSHVFISSLSGSGKTLTYLIPLVDKIMNCKQKLMATNPKMNINGNNGSNSIKTLSYHELIVDEMLEYHNYNEFCGNNLPLYIILTPTQILADQIKKTINDYFGKLNINAITRDDIYLQNGNQQTASFFVTTPSSCVHCLKKFEMRGNDISGIIMDEADVIMKDFSMDLDQLINLPCISKKFIKNHLPFTFVSASLPEDSAIVFLETYFPDIKFITQFHHMMAPNTEFKFQRVDQEQLKKKIVDDITHFINHGRTTLVFTLTISNAIRVHDHLAENNIKSLLITSEEDDLNQKFELIGNEYQVAVTTDICSRGIHIKNIDTIINYNFPRHPTGFLHRIGRTARLGGCYANHPLVYSYLVRRSDIYIANHIIQNFKATGAIYNLPFYSKK